MLEKLRDLVSDLVDHVERKVRGWTRPRESVFLGAASDLPRGKKGLVVENALLRQQVIAYRPGTRSAMQRFEIADERACGSSAPQNSI